MKAVNVKRSDLISALKANRERHSTEAKEAKAGYLIAVEKALKKALRDLRKGEAKTNLGMMPPIDKTSDYDRAIQMMEMSVDETVELTEQEFRQYVQDEWSWKDAAIALNSTYALGAVIGKPAKGKIA